MDASKLTSPSKSLRQLQSARASPSSRRLSIECIQKSTPMKTRLNSSLSNRVNSSPRPMGAAPPPPLSEKEKSKTLDSAMVNEFLMLRAAAVAPTSLATPTVKPPQLPKSPQQQTTPTRRVARSLPPTAETARLAMEASAAARLSLAMNNNTQLPPPPPPTNASPIEEDESQEMMQKRIAALEGEVDLLQKRLTMKEQMIAKLISTHERTQQQLQDEIQALKHQLTSK